jgi:hypothetical protein
MRGQASRVWYGDPAYTQRGSFPSAELLTNGTFGSGATGWTPSSANISLAVTDRILRSTRVSVSADETIRSAALTTVTGATYIARVMAYAGRGAMDFRIRLGTSAGGSELAATPADITSGGLASLVATATGTSTFFSVVDGVSGRSIGNYMDFAFFSLSRCALVNGASQVSSSINIDALPASTRASRARVTGCRSGTSRARSSSHSTPTHPAPAFFISLIRRARRRPITRL